jgi:hypothetical protein
VVHAVVLVGVVLLVDEPESADTEPTEQATSREAKKLNVQMTAPPEEIETRETPDEKEPEPEEKPDKPEPEQKKEEPQETKDLDRKAVVQETNEQNPEQADYVSEQANKVDRETRARETTQKPVEPSKTSAEKQQREATDESAAQTQRGSKMAARSQSPPKPPTSESTPPPEPTESEPTETEQRESSEKAAETEAKEVPSKSQKAPAPAEDRAAEQSSEGDQPMKPLPMPTQEDYEEMFDAEADRRKMEKHAEKGPGNDMFRRIEKQDGAVRAAMENYIGEVQPGNHTAVNAKKDVAATYINRIHSKVHPRWGGDYLPSLDRNYGPGHPLSNSDLNTVLELAVDGETGKLEEVTIIESSGLTSYDMEAIHIVKSVAPNPEAPEALRSPNGNVYLHWNFWRDQRQCGTFGVSIYKLREDGTKRETVDSKTE